MMIHCINDEANLNFHDHWMILWLVDHDYDHKKIIKNTVSIVCFWVMLLHVHAGVVPRHLSPPGFASLGRGSARALREASLAAALRIHLLNGTNSDVEYPWIFHSNKGLIYLHKYIYLWRCLLFSSKGYRGESGDRQHIRPISGRFFTWYNVYPL